MEAAGAAGGGRSSRGSPPASTPTTATATATTTTTTTTAAEALARSPVSPLSLKSAAVLETQLRLLRHLQSSHFRDPAVLDAQDCKTLAGVLAQCQTLLTVGSQVLQVHHVSAVLPFYFF